MAKSRKKTPTVDCVACRAKIKKGSIVCDICGAPQQELEPCPHCRGKGSVTVDAELQLQCNLCGGPRIPHLPEEYEATGKEKASLVKAESARKSRGLWRGAGIFGAITIPFVLLFALVIGLIFGFTPALATALILGGPFAVLAAFAYRKSTAKTKEIATAIDQAWVSVSMDLAEQFQGRMRARDLSDALGIEHARAEQLMAMLSVSDVLQSSPRATVAPDERFARLEEEFEEQEDDNQRIRVKSEPEAEPPPTKEDARATKKDGQAVPSTKAPAPTKKSADASNERSDEAATEARPTDAEAEAIAEAEAQLALEEEALGSAKTVLAEKDDK